MKKRFLACLLTVCMLVAMLPTMAFAADIKYVDLGGHWCEEPIYEWSAKGIVNGVGKDANGGDLFDPDGLLTRAQAAAIFARLLALEESANISFFVDVPANEWYTDYVAKCYAAGIVNGKSSTSFAPGDYLTRAEMFTMFCRALSIEGQDAADKNFDDARQVPAYAKEYANALVNLGYVSGVTATTLQPMANITRAQMVKLLDNAIVAYITEDGEYTINEDGIVLVIAEDVEISGKGDITIVVTKEDAEIDLDDAEGEVTVIAKADNVTVKNAPEGTTIITTGVEGVTANGKELDEVDKIVIEDKKPSSGSGNNTVVIPDHECEWDEGVVTKEPTCTEKGEKTYTCKCNDTYTEKIPALGHTEAEAVVENEVEPTCKEDGSYDSVVYCDVCGEELSRVEMTGEPASKDYCVGLEDNLCDVCGKFYAGISTSADNSGAVEVTVDDEFVATLKITEGALKASEVNIAVAMNNVASLDADKKAYDTTIEIESLEDIEVTSLKDFLPGVYAYENATDVEVIVNGEEMLTYTVNPIVVDEETGNAEIVAEPTAGDASETWAALVNKNTVKTAENDGDSYILINNGSYMQIGTEKLSFTDTAKDLKLDNFDKLTSMKDDILEAVELETGLTNNNAVVLYAGAGCEMAIGESKATLLQDTKVTITGVEIADEAAYLSELKAVVAEDPANMALYAVAMVNKLAELANEADVITVEIEMIEPAELTTKVAAEITTAAEDGSVKVEVLSDYSATLTIDGGVLAPSEVVVSLEMTDIGSLDVEGTKKHSDTFYIESLKDYDALEMPLYPFLNSVFEEKFQSADILAVFEGNEVAYEVVHEGVEDGVAVISATPTNEASAREMWQDLTSYVTVDENGDDSSILLKEGCYMQIGTEAVELNDDLELNNLSALSALMAEILDKVDMKTGLDNEIVLLVKEGCMIDIGGTFAVLDADMLFTVDGVELDGVLSELQKLTEEAPVEMVAGAVTLLDLWIAALDGADVTVTIEIVD